MVLLTETQSQIHGDMGAAEEGKPRDSRAAAPTLILATSSIAQDAMLFTTLSQSHFPRPNGQQVPEASGMPAVPMLCLFPVSSHAEVCNVPAASRTPNPDRAGRVIIHYRQNSSHQTRAYRPPHRTKRGMSVVSEAGRIRTGQEGCGFTGPWATGHRSKQPLG